jgi:PleD family two-component response regulator
MENLNSDINPNQKIYDSADQSKMESTSNRMYSSQESQFNKSLMNNSPNIEDLKDDILNDVFGSASQEPNSAVGNTDIPKKQETQPTKETPEVNSKPITPNSTIDYSKEDITILTIDDDKWIQRIYTQYLTQWGFKHLMANDPFVGIEEAITEKPTLIFLDMILPEVNGLTVLQFLKNLKFTKEIPVVVVSGNMNKDLIKATFPYGVKGYVTKPFNQDTLYLKIKEVVDRNLFNGLVKAGKIAELDIKKKVSIPNV